MLSTWPDVFNPVVSDSERSLAIAENSPVHLYEDRNTLYPPVLAGKVKTVLAVVPVGTTAEIIAAPAYQLPILPEFCTCIVAATPPIVALDSVFAGLPLVQWTNWKTVRPEAAAPMAMPAAVMGEAALVATWAHVA